MKLNRIRRRHKLLLAGATAVVTFATLTTPANAQTGTLPGGTSITVSVDTPADGAVLPAGHVTATGTATVGQGTHDDISLIYVLDVSGSTISTGGCGGDVNGDGTANSTLDCEIAAAKALNAEAISLGTVSSVGAAVFGDSSATADVTPGGGDDPLTGPATDANGTGGPDVDQVLSSVKVGSVGLFQAHSVGSSTNFASGVSAALSAASAASTARTVVVFLSDGMSNGSGSVDTPLAGVPAGVTFYTFAVGSGSSCTDSGSQGSLDHIATATGGQCTAVTDVSSLPSILPAVIQSKLSSLSFTVDGQADASVSATPSLPQSGPASAGYTVTTTNALAPGSHTLCATAAGSDRAGPGTVKECHTIVINAPPVVHAGGSYSGQEGSPVSLAGTVTDPDGPTETSAWTVTPSAGVDPGTTCSFGDPTAVSTTVTCTDDGTFTLTLTAKDTVNAPVSSSSTLTLTNVAPSVTISAPAAGTLYTKGSTVSVTAPFTDVATNDTHTCTVDFADGTPVATGTVTESHGSGTCKASHAYTAVGSHTILVKVTDDNGGSATATVKVVVYLKGEAFALDASGPVTIAKTPLATCPPNSTLTVATVGLAPLASVNGLNASCTLDAGTGTTVAKASIDSASLVAGAITVGNLSVSCVSAASGVTRTSTVGTINGTTIGSGSGSLVVPLIGTVYFNESTTDSSGRLVRNAVRVKTLLGQEIILGSCALG